jgi:hypothetical protein
MVQPITPYDFEQVLLALRWRMDKGNELCTSAHFIVICELIFGICPRWKNQT